MMCACACIDMSSREALQGTFDELYNYISGPACIYVLNLYTKEGIDNTYY